MISNTVSGKLNPIIEATASLGNRFIAVAVNSVIDVLTKHGFHGDDLDVFCGTNTENEDGPTIRRIKDQLSFLGSAIIHESVIKFNKIPSKRTYIFVINKEGGVPDQLWFFRHFQNLDFGMTCYHKGVMVILA